MANVTITQLPQAGPITGTESVPIVQNGQTVQTTTAAIAASPSQTQTFLTINSEATLPNSRYLSTGTGLGLTDGGALSFYRITLNRAAGSLETALTGIVAKDTASSVVARTLQASGSGLSVSDGNGVSGNPTFSLTGQVASLANASGAGFVSLPNNGSVVIRTITGTADQIDVADGTGATGNPTIKLADNPVLPGFSSVTFPVGGNSDRPISPINGMFRYNTDLGAFEGYANGSWGAVVTGSGVVSVNASGGTTGMSFTGGPITSSGTLTLTGTLGAANGGTGLATYAVGDITYASGATALSKLTLGTAGYFLTAGASAPQWSDPTLLTVGTASLATTATNLANGAQNRIAYQTGSSSTSFIDAPTLSNTFLKWDGSVFSWAAAAGGSVTSVDVSGGTTGISFTGGPITSSGTITMSGVLNAVNGGTGQSAYTAGDLLYASASTTLAKLALGASTYVLVAGVSAPEYVAQSTLSVGSAATASSATTATNLAGGVASQIPYQSAAGATAFIANGTAGQVLTSAGAGTPVWSGISGGTF